ncbi:hypothetical protein CDN99_04905 [Roseateles aquatilis]|uniref:CheR-type methyltransferase domain-containing protein n=1 Tax=Roseateles aquatilis TaxID=431061 RepID=A0A246JMA3_9BURK|nr:protein-glutamate O-methyltransferase CheR [Roseateles aquatilis]OWQ93784.1 hypothetical protein CDN99_04905 [Roseateles aquatilis]
MTRPEPLDPAQLPRLRALLAARLGLQFDERQDSRLTTALGRVAGPIGATALLDRMELAPTRDQLDALAGELTVGETFFFRHPEQFDALRFDLLPALTQRLAGDAALASTKPRRLRVLSAGCASGEEAYTLAITLQRAGLAAQGIDWDVLAVDLNPAVIARALDARYGEWSLRATPPELRHLWFRRVDRPAGDPQGATPDGDAWRPLPSIRERVRFEPRHLGLPDPLFWAPGSFDVIFCRNVLMYLEPGALSQAIRNLTGALAPGGVLFLGHAETLRGHTDALALRQSRGCFFYQRDAAHEARREWPFPWPPMSQADVGREHAMPPAPPVAHRVASMASSAAPDTEPGELALLDEALLLVEAGQIEDGLRACSRLISPTTPAGLQAEVFFLQALAMEERGQLPAAEWNHQRAAAKDAGFAMPHLRLGLLARRRGEVVAARRELRRALELLDGESEDRLRRFGGGFERDDLRRLCRDEIGEARA